MPEQLEGVQRHAAGNGLDAEAVPKAFGVACGPVIFAASMTAQKTCQPFVRLQSHSRTDLPRSLRFCAARTL
jgi:hypothetical protein